jgi:hypothetical protein
MLGIFGCVPAFDGFFTDTFGRLFRKKGCAFSTFSKDALKKIGKFYGDHDTTINRLARETRTIDFQTGNQTDRLKHTTTSIHIYAVRPRTDKRCVDLTGDVLLLGPLWYAGPNAINNAINYAKFFSGYHDHL